MNHSDDASQGDCPSYVEQVSVVVRTLRAFFSLSQGDLAKASGVSRPTINRVETLRDVEKVRAGTLEALLAVFRRLGVQLELTERGLVMAVSIAGMRAAIEAGKHSHDKELKAQTKLEIMRRASERALRGEPVVLGEEQTRQLMESFSESTGWSRLQGPAGGEDDDQGKGR